MIRTWIADIRPLFDAECYARYYQSVPKLRQEKADHIKDIKKKAQSIGAWVLYDKVRKQYGISERAIYNFSHSGDYVLCSIDDCANPDTKLGCDLEEIKEMHLKIVEKYFFPEEQNFIMEQKTENAKAQAFYRYWVLKESFMKATRKGMKLGLDSFEIRIKEGKDPKLVQMPKEEEGIYYLKEYVMDIPYKIGVCSTDRNFAEEIQKVAL